MDLAADNAIQRFELRKLNECILRKNHSIMRLRENLQNEKNKVKLLKSLPPRIVERDSKTGVTIRTSGHVAQLSDEDLHAISKSVYGGTPTLDDAIEHIFEGAIESIETIPYRHKDEDDYIEFGDSENPDSGKA